MKRVVVVSMAVALGATAGFAQNRPWNNPGGGTTAPANSVAAPKRDISGIWDAAQGGIAPRGMQTSPLTPAGEAIATTHHSGDGVRQVAADKINDPLSVMA